MIRKRKGNGSEGGDEEKMRRNEREGRGEG